MIGVTSSLSWQVSHPGNLTAQRDGERPIRMGLRSVLGSMTSHRADWAQQDNGGAARQRLGIGVLIAGTAATIVLAGCGSSGHGPGTTPSTGPDRQAASGACATPRTGLEHPWSAVSGTTWPERRIGTAAASTQNYSGLAVDPASDIAYALIPRAASRQRGPYRLECTALATGMTRKGPELQAPGLALASGYLWAFGQPGRPPGRRPDRSALLARDPVHPAPRRSCS